MLKNKKLYAILTLVAFMITLMPVMAFAGVNYQESYVYTTANNPTINESDESDTVDTADTTNITFSLKANKGESVTGQVYFWVQETGDNVPSTALQMDTTSKDSVWDVYGNGFPGIYVADADDLGRDNFKVWFTRDGEYRVYASVQQPVKKVDESIASALDKLDGLLKTDSSMRTITVDPKSVKNDDYRFEYAGDLWDGSKELDPPVKISATNVASKDITLFLQDTDGNVLRQKTVKIEPNSSNITVSKETVETNALGKVSFNITASREGTYYVYISVGNFEVKLPVIVGAAGAASIETVKEPTAPVDLDTSDLSKKIKFQLFDINGNALKGDLSDAKSGAQDAFANTDDKYVVLTEKPSKATLKNKNLSLVNIKSNGEKTDEYTIDLGSKTLDAEGTYTFKVILDNGAYALATIEVKEFQTPVELNLRYDQEAVELGGKSSEATVEWVDANGVTKDAMNKVDLAASGYAIDNFQEKDGVITVKRDEKYVGSTITITAVDSRYNLVATTTIEVADEAQSVEFATNRAQVNVNNKIDFQIVDSQGNKVAPGSAVSNTNVSFVVLSKPADAKVSAVLSSSTDLANKGTGTMALTSNKEGDVTVQVIVKLNRDGVTKYYTGTETFTVGKDATGSVYNQLCNLVIGQKTFFVNGEPYTSDVAPFVQDGRTFLPLRAISEAVGAEIGYDAATQVVTITQKDAIATMTIGSKVMTKGSETVEMDVAPFIVDGRTVVPVRYVGEVLGFEVNYDQTTGSVTLSK